MCDRALYVKNPWAGKLVRGEKTMELRSKRTTVRGWVAIIESGTATAIGAVRLSDCKEFKQAELKALEKKHCVPADLLGGYSHAWICAEAVAFANPVPIPARKGCVVWQNLTDDQRAAVESLLPADAMNDE